VKLLRSPKLRAYLGLAVLAAGLLGLALSGDLLVHAARFTAFYVLAGAGFAVLAARRVTASGGEAGARGRRGARDRGGVVARESPRHTGPMKEDRSDRDPAEGRAAA